MMQDAAFPIHMKNLCPCCLPDRREEAVEVSLAMDAHDGMAMSMVLETVIEEPPPSMPPPPVQVKPNVEEADKKLNPPAVPSMQDGQKKTQEFDVQIEKDTGGLGLDITAHDGTTMLIGQVKEGPVTRWNSVVTGAGESFQVVRRGDRIVEANDNKGDAAQILAVLRGAKSLGLKISRLMEFRISAFDSQGNVGLEFDVASGKDLIVKAVNDGTVRHINRKIGAEMELRPGDRILEVNGISGDAQSLGELIAKQQTLELLIRRPPT